MIRGLGYLPDPPDERDQDLDALLGSALASSPPPVSGDVSDPRVGPKDQDLTNSCPGQGAALGIRLAYLAAGLECPDLSALDAYYKSRAEWGGQRLDQGSYCRSTIKAIQHAGIADESSWPFNPANVNRRPSWAAARSAFDRRGVRGYYRLYSADDVRRAIAARHPVYGGWDVDRAFMEYDGTGVIDVPTGEILGGHAFVIQRYFADGTFEKLGSWGLGWGRDGRALLTERMVEAGRDKWAIVVNS